MAVPTGAGRELFDAVAEELSGELDICETVMFAMASLKVRDGTVIKRVADARGDLGPGRCTTSSPELVAHEGIGAGAGDPPEPVG
jgi:hypothetical protein